MPDNGIYLSVKPCLDSLPIFIRFLDHKRLLLKGWYKCPKCGTECRGEDLVFNAMIPGIPEFKCTNETCRRDFFQMELMGGKEKAILMAEKQSELADKSVNNFQPFPNISVVRTDFSAFGGDGWEVVRCAMRNKALRGKDVPEPPLKLFPDDSAHIEMVELILRTGRSVEGASMDIGLRQSDISRQITGNITKIRKMLGELKHMGYLKAEKVDKTLYWGIQDDRL